MNTKSVLTAIVVVLVVAGIGAGFYFYQQQKESPDNAQAPAPSYGTEAPLENKPDVNPVDKTNPFKDVKTNPFE